nr:M56 family metallopeptidase [Armatimonas sp.]
MTDTLLRASLQSGVALLVLAVLCRLCARLPAHTRCGLWRLGYVKCLVAFVFSTTLAIPILSTSSSLPASESLFLASESLPLATESSPPVSEEAPPAAESPSGTAKWASGMAFLYFLGVVVAALHLLIAATQTALLLQRATPTSHPALAPLTQGFGLRRAPRIARLASFTSPLLAFNTILLPEPALADEHLILAHELAHLKRHDLFWEALGAFVGVLLWFHPLVWYARREEKLAREQAADALVLAVTNAPRAEYARVLLTTTLRHTPALAVGAFERPSCLRRRLEALAQPTLPKHKVLGLMLLVCLLVVPALIPWRAVARQATVAPLPLEPQVTFTNGVTVQGQLTDGLTHKPMAGVRVIALTKDTSLIRRGVEIPQERQVNTTRTDHEGRYYLSLPAKTLCRIEAVILVPLEGKEGWSVDGTSRRLHEQSSRTVSGEAGQVLSADLVAISMQPVQGAVIDANNIPVANAEITLLSGVSGPYKTDSKGNFSIPESQLSLGTKQGNYGYRDHKTGKFITTNYREERKTIRLRVIRGEESADIEVPATSLEPLTLRLEKGKLVKVFGRVVDDLGRAVGGVAVSGASSLNVHPFDTRWLKTTTDATGAFTFFITPGQVFHFGCTKLGYGAVGYNPGAPAVLSKPHNAGKLVLFRATARVDGFVLTPEGKPATKATVQIYGTHNNYRADTDVQGHFTAQVVPTNDLKITAFWQKEKQQFIGSGTLPLGKQTHIIRLAETKPHQL